MVPRQRFAYCRPLAGAALIGLTFLVLHPYRSRGEEGEGGQPGAATKSEAADEGESKGRGVRLAEVGREVRLAEVESKLAELLEDVRNLRRVTSQLGDHCRPDQLRDIVWRSDDGSSGDISTLSDLYHALSGPSPHAEAAPAEKNAGEQPALEVLAEHPRQAEVALTEEFAGRLGELDGDSIHVTFDVDERSYLRYQRIFKKKQVEGSDAKISAGLGDDVGFPHAGKLRNFADRVDPTTGTVKAYGSIHNPDGLYLPGMFARVRLTLEPAEKMMLQIPEGAILNDHQGNPYVIVLTSEGIARRRNVSLGPAEGGLRTVMRVAHYLTTGVSADDRVVTGVVTGVENVPIGARVKLRSLRE
jgi:multidrug efflux pump subunit AcrA (membrane-fusion protein)